MYTSGWPKTQNRFSYRYWLPPPLGMKKVVWAVRSSIAIESAAISTGAASSISDAVESTPQQKIGRRDHVSPGARMVTIVAIMFRPSSVIESPTSAKKTMYESMPAFAWSFSGW